MYNLLAKRGQLFALLLGAALVALFLLQVLGGSGEFAGLSPEAQKETGIFNFGLKAAIGLSIICAIVALVFGLIQMVTNPKGALKSIIFIVALAALFFIAYSTAQGAATGSLAETMAEFKVNAGISKFISGAMWTTMILAVLAMAAMVISELVNLFR